MGIVMMIVGIALAFGIMFFLNKTEKIKKDIATLFIASFLVALVLEIFTFNYTTYENIGQSLKKSESVITYDQAGVKSSNDDYFVTKEDGSEKPTFTVEIKNIDSKVNNVFVEVPKDIESAKVSVDYKDEVITEYLPINDSDINVVSGTKSTQYIRLHLAGKTSALKLKIVSNDLVITSGMIKAGVNQDIPFRFKAWRMVVVTLVFFAMALIYRYRNLNYAGEKSKKVRKIAIASLLVVQILFLYFLAYAQMKPKDGFLFEDTKTNTVSNYDQYQKLAIAFTKGQTHLDGVDEFTENGDKRQLDVLKELKDPYKPFIRDKVMKDKGSSYEWDYAYNDGHYYTYYGPVPVIFTFLPVYALTGIMLTTRLITFIFAAIISLLVCLLVHNIAKRRKLNMWAVIGVMGASLSTIFLTSVFYGAQIYELSPLGGLICILAGINLVYEGVHRENKNTLFLSLGALAFALAVGCKASFLLASIVVLPLILNYLANKGNSEKKNKLARYFANIFCKENIKTIVAVASPYVVIGILLMIYNQVRFGSPFDFGVAHQLTVYDTSYFKLTSISKLPTVIQNGLLRLPKTSANFPFLELPDTEITYHGYLFAMGGIGVLAYPFIWAFVGVPVTVKNSLKGSKDKAFVIASAIMALVLCYTTIVMGGASFRYSLDFGWAFAIPSIFVIFAIEGWARKKGVLRQALLGIFVVLLATIIINVLVTMSTGFSGFTDTRPDIYYDVYNTVMFWK